MSIDFVKTIYKLTYEFPCEEKYGIVQQLQAAISTPVTLLPCHPKPSY